MSDSNPELPETVTADRSEREDASGWTTLIYALALTVLFATVVLGYGADNLVLSSKIPVPLLWILFGGLLLLTGLRGLEKLWLHHRAVVVLCTLSLLAGLARLAMDIPTYGLWALRSSIFFVSSVGLVAGVYLGWRLRARWYHLVVIPLSLQLVYTLSLPWHEELLAISPVSGVFVRAPVLGHYGYFPMAVAGVWAAFFVVGRLNFAGLAIPAIALVGVALKQARLGYAAVLLGAALGFLVVSRSRSLRPIVMKSTVAAWVLAVFLVVVTLVPMPGRYGPFDPGFLLSHAGTVLGREGPALGSMIHRYTEYPIAVKELITQPFRPLVLGNGLGAPIELGVSGIYRKTLHLDYVEVIYRIGLGGVFWVLSVLGVAVVVVRKARAQIVSQTLAVQERRALLMICGVLLMSLVMSGFQPLFFWAYGSLPFFLYGGIALGVLDRIGSEERATVTISAPDSGEG